MNQCLRAFCFLFVFSFSVSAFAVSSNDQSVINSKISNKSEISPSIFSSRPFLVSASRLPSFKKTPKDFPSNVSIVTRERLDQVSPVKFQDAVQSLEGVHFYDQTGNGLDSTFGIRGFNSGSESVFLVDGVRVNEVDGNGVLLPLVAMDNVDSIEVARGSSSAVYGSGAFGGVVNIQTKKPSPKPWSLFGGADWTSFQGVHFFDGISRTIKDKVTGLNGGLGYYFEMGRNMNRGFRENGEIRETPLDAKLSYELPDEEGGIRFNYKNMQDALSNPGALTRKEYSQDSTQSMTYLDGRKMQNKIISVNANKKFWDDRLNASIQASIRRRTSRILTTFRTFTDCNNDSFPCNDEFNPDTNLVTSRSHEHNVIAQLAYQDDWASWLKNEILGGVELNKGFSHDLQQDAFGGHVVERTPKEAVRSGEDASIGIFGNESIKLFDQLTQQFGARGQFDYLAFTDELNHANDFNRHWRDLSVSTGTIWGPVKWGELFWNYAQAFRTPAFFQINSFGGDPSVDLTPEKAKSFEFGTRLRYKEKAQFKFSYFDIVRRDEILFDSTAITSTNPFGRNANAGKTRRNGIELYGDWKPIEEAFFFGTYTFTNAVLRETIPSLIAFQHRPLGQTPENRFTFGTSAQPLKRFGVPYDGFHVWLEAVFVGRQHNQSFETASQTLLNSVGGMIKAYQVWNLKLSYEWKKKELFFKINNLFDEQYFPRAIAATSFGTVTTPPGNYLFVNPGPPREFMTGMRYEFD